MNDTVFDENGVVLFSGTTGEVLAWLNSNPLQENHKCRVRMGRASSYLIGVWEYRFMYN